MKNEKKALEKKGWVSNFTLRGYAKINERTFKLDAQSENSDWTYNSLNLRLDCGEKLFVYSELMGGYHSQGESVVYAIGKKENDNGDIVDDYSNRLQIKWEDRFDYSILEDVGDSSLIKIGIEKDKNGKLVINKFISEYDAIKYLHSVLEPDMILDVRGRMIYSTYNNKTQCRKKIQSIYIAHEENQSEDKFLANFNQTLLINKECWGDIDKNSSTVKIHTKVLDYAKEWDGQIVKQNIPFNFNFDFQLDLNNQILVKQIKERLFSPRKNYSQVTFEGKFMTIGNDTNVTEEDIPADIMALVDLGLLTLEDVKQRCVSSDYVEQRMVLKVPYIKKVTEDGRKTSVIDIIEDIYTEDDLTLDFMVKSESDDENNFYNTEDSDNSFEDFLNDLN